MNRAKLITVAAIKREKEQTENRLYHMASHLIESRARKILLAHPGLDEFIMSMGAWMFTRHGSMADISPVYREYIPGYAKSFTRMMDEFDDMELKVTGEPMRFTARGPKVTDWGATDGLDGAGVAKRYAEVICALP